MSLRYHALSITAIFIALGLGILIGASMAGDQGMLDQQKAIIGKLDSDFRAMALERDSMGKELDAYRRYAQESLPYVVRNVLADKRIAVLDMGSGEVAASSAISVCESAGGAAGAHVEFDPSLLDGLPGEYIDAVAAAISSCDPARINALATMGVATVKKATKGKFDAVLILAPSDCVSEGVMNFIDSISTEERMDGRPVVLGWTGKGLPEGFLRAGQRMSFGQITEVHGVGLTPANAAAVLGLAGSRGCFGYSPATAFLPTRSAMDSGGAR